MNPFNVLWLTKRLHMGHPCSASRLMSRASPLFTRQLGKWIPLINNIRSRFVYLLICLTVAFEARADPETLEQFKKLPLATQERLVGDESTPTEVKYSRWLWRIGMGEEAWKQKEDDRLIKAEGHEGLIKLFEWQQTEWVLRQSDPDEFALLSSTSSAIRAAETTRRNAEIDAVHARYCDAYQLVLHLAPTQEAAELNTKAQTLFTLWSNRFPYGQGKGLITRADLEKLGARVQVILDNLKKLPKRTVTETQAAIDTLAPDSPNKTSSDPEQSDDLLVGGRMSLGKAMMAADKIFSAEMVLPRKNGQLELSRFC